MPGLKMENRSVSAPVQIPSQFKPLRLEPKILNQPTISVPENQ